MKQRILSQGFGRQLMQCVPRQRPWPYPGSSLRAHCGRRCAHVCMRMCVCVCARAPVRVRVRVCVRIRVRVRVRVRVPRAACRLPRTACLVPRTACRVLRTMFYVLHASKHHESNPPLSQYTVGVELPTLLQGVGRTVYCVPCCTMYSA